MSRYQFISTIEDLTGAEDADLTARTCLREWHISVLLFSRK